MIHHIPNVLTKEQVQYFRHEMDQVSWINGKVTAGTLSANVKQNQQLPEDHPLTQHLSTIILESLGQHPLFLSTAIPLDIIPPLFNRYEQQESFGFIASFFWVQSMIRDEANRHMLFNLDQSIQNLRIELGDQHLEVMKLTNLYHNLMRKWAEL